MSQPKARVAWTPIQGPFSHPEQEIAKRYMLPLDNDLYNLLEYIRCLGTRDLFKDWSADKFMMQRQAAAESLTRIQDESVELQSLAKRLKEYAIQFEERFEYLPSLMTEICTEDFGDPDQLHIPEGISAVSRFVQDDAFMSKLDEHCEALKAIPRRPVVGGTVSHTILKSAVGACREYWQAQGRGWTSKMLDVTEPGDDPSILESEAERFLVDVLGGTMFEFDLLELKRAWRNR